MKKTAIALALCMMVSVCCACTQTRPLSTEPEAKTDIPATSAPEAASTVSYKENGADFSLDVFDSWSAQPFAEDGQYGLILSPKAQPELKYELALYARGFGVCGTGLEEKQLSINGMDALAGYYDGADYWSFVSIDADGKNYVLTWTYDGDADVQQLGIAEYNARIMTMLGSLEAN